MVRTDPTIVYQSSHKLTLILTIMCRQPWSKCEPCTRRTQEITKNGAFGEEGRGPEQMVKSDPTIVYQSSQNQHLTFSTNTPDPNVTLVHEHKKLLNKVALGEEGLGVSLKIWTKKLKQLRLGIFFFFLISNVVYIKIKNKKKSAKCL